MDQRSGTGPEQRGPSFTPWQSGDTPATPQPPPPQPPSPQPPSPHQPLVRSHPVRAEPPPVPGPPRNPWPTVVTVLALVVVGSIVVAATILGGGDGVTGVGEGSRPASAGPRPSPAASDRMEFVSDDGDGVLIVTASRWSSSGLPRPLHGSYLHVQVELVCTTGQLSYGPDNFSAFDATGELFEVLDAQRTGIPLGRGVLGYGVLGAGESVRGSIAFDLPRGDVTLLLSDSASRSVTALRIPD